MNSARPDSTEVENVNIVQVRFPPTPHDVKVRFALTENAKQTVLSTRSAIEHILNGEDSRLVVVVGPCSIHDGKAAREYASKLKLLADEVKDTMLLVMRVYFEKPRTSVGWKGFINDPFLDDSFRIDEGLYLARELLLDINHHGLPVGTEALDPISPQYFSDLISWTAIGARTTESQTHREMASGLSSPVGFKNGMDGSIDVAINALRSASRAHRFLGIDANGRCAILETRGNRYGHIVLRGGTAPNYDPECIAKTEAKLKESKLPAKLIVDCSHGNSNKDYRRQPVVFENCLDQIGNGTRSIIGFMLESNLHEGRQDIPQDLSQLKYGVSLTDSCMSWEQTESLLKAGHQKLLPLMEKV